MCLGSLDHSPSEQLGNPDQWHTTVLILSQSNEHWKLAECIATFLRSESGSLRRWSARHSRYYKTNFDRILTENVTKFPVHIRAISAQSETIRLCLDHMLAELGLAGLVKSSTKKEKPYLEFGPFSRIRITDVRNGVAQEDHQPVQFTLPERQAIPLVFICHFLLRAHQQIFPLVRDEQPTIEWVDWQLMPNKFPGGIDGRMASLFHAIMSGSARAGLVMGNIRIMTFVNTGDDHGSIFADNLAGLLADKLSNGDQKLMLPPSLKIGSSMFWEIWRREGAC